MAVYEEPFWRADGLSGNTVATDDLVEVTLDTTQPGHPHGVIGTYSAGPRAPRPVADGRDGAPCRAGADAHHADSGPRRRGRSRCSRSTGPRSAGRAGVRWATSPPACSPSTAGACASPSAASTGPAPRRPASPTGRWTARSARASARCNEILACRPPESGAHPSRSRPGTRSPPRASPGRRSGSGPAPRGSACPPDPSGARSAPSAPAWGARGGCPVPSRSPPR